MCLPCCCIVDAQSAGLLAHKVKKHFLHRVDNVREKKWLN